MSSLMTGGEKNGFWTYKWEENYVKTLSVKVQDNRNTAYKKNSEKTFGSSVSLSLRTKCLDCLSGTQGCTYINTHTPKHRHKNTHTQVTAVAGCAAFCHLPGFPTPVLNVNSFILLYLEEVGEWWGEQKHQTTKKVPNNAAIFAASTAAVSFSSPSSSSLSLPLCPPFTFTLPHRISLSSALESSSVSAHAELHCEKTWRNKVGRMSPQQWRWPNVVHCCLKVTGSKFHDILRHAFV